VIESLGPFLSYVQNAPVIPMEQSWPEAHSLVDLAGAGGGLGLGVMVASGALGPAALLIIPTGILTLTVARRITRRAARWVDPPARRIEDLYDLLKRGRLTTEQYERQVQRILDDDTDPVPTSSAEETSPT
jgi:hypothetical protein